MSDRPEYLSDEQVAAAAALLDHGIVALAREVQATRKTLDAIDALHRTEEVGSDGPVTYWHDCMDCGQEWPCRTHRILHPEEVTE